jgi:glycosyltransferase involved in cell wall biosynthesis
MHIAILTRSLPPENCGIGDHSLQLAQALRLQGNKVTIIAGRGNPKKDVYITKDDWSKLGLNELKLHLEKLDIDHLVLQYTPLTFSGARGKQNFSLLDFWKRCSQQWKTSIILHETYFRVWWYPLSLLKGTFEKRLMLLLAETSDHVFTASQPLENELCQKTLLRDKVHRLPLGSHFRAIEINREHFRQQHNISPETNVLTLFGGGTNLWLQRSYIDELDSFLHQSGIPICWLLLGGVPLEWFHLRGSILSPGRLPSEDISAWLQMTDILLMPHKCGLSAKRSTLSAALQHSLPAIGTYGKMTDDFWKDVSGVTLVSPNQPEQFQNAVIKLCIDKPLRESQGKENCKYFKENFSWETIAHTFLRKINVSICQPLKD